MKTPKPGTLGHLLAPKPKPVAKRDYVHEVGRDLNLDTEAAQRVADYVLAQVEAQGAENARLVMIVDESEDAGTGPWCSWCWMVGGLCSHIVGKATRESSDPTVPFEHPSAPLEVNRG